MANKVKDSLGLYSYYPNAYEIGQGGYKYPENMNEEIVCKDTNTLPFGLPFMMKPEKFPGEQSIKRALNKEYGVPDPFRKDE